MSAKYKKFIEKFKQAWKEVYSDAEYDKRQAVVLTTNISDIIMKIDIKERFKVLANIEAKVLKDTKAYTEDLRVEREIIMEELSKYKEDLTKY